MDRGLNRQAAVTTGIGVLTTDALRAAPGGGGLVSSSLVAAAGQVPRRPPDFIAADAVWPRFRAALDGYFARPVAEWMDRYLLELDQPLLVGEGSVLTSGDRGLSLLRESAAEFLAHDTVPTGLRRDTADSFALDQPVARRIDQPCLLLKRPWSDNFGHWMIDQAMALAYLVRANLLPARDLVVTRAGGALAPSMRAMVAAILPGAVLHEHPHDELWQFRRLFYLTPLHVPPLTKHPGAIEALRDSLLPVTPAFDAPPRLHIVRDSRLRVLTNEAEIVALTRARGFTLVRPETGAIAAQIALFRGAEAIIGVKGAALTNILFAPAGCRVMVLSPGSFIDPFYWDLASLRGQPYAEVFGPVTTERASPGHNDFRIDPADLAAMLDAMALT